MRRFGWFFAWFFLTPPLLADSGGLAVASASQVVMGTVLEVTVTASGTEEAARLASEAITIARHWDQVLSPFLDHSELRLLHKQQGRPVFVSESLDWALQRAVDLTRATGGAFEPAYLSALPPGATGREPMPLLPKVVLWRQGGVLLQPGARIDPGAFGKGIAVDAILDWVRRQGATEVFVNFGGSSFARAASRQLRRHPRRILLPDNDGRALGIVELVEGSLSVSESGVHDDASPITDPRSGAPVASRRMAAAWAREGIVADAWSTALVVLGRDGLVLARQHRVEAAIIDDQGVAITKGFPCHRWPRHEELTKISAVEDDRP